MTDQPKPLWREIIADYTERDGVFLVTYVDAFQTDDPNEDGDNIARLIGVYVDGEPHVHVVFKNTDAQVDDKALAVIHQATLDMRVNLTPLGDA